MPIKYGVIDDALPYSTSNMKINIGDFFQMDVLRRIVCDFIGDNVVHLKMKDIRTYNGEDIILPMQWGLFYPSYMEGDRISISKNIHPIFISASLSVENRNEYFNEHNIEYLNSIAPIGCRDEITRNLLRKFGIESYLLGCVTHLLPRRNDFGTTVFFADAPIELNGLIPIELLSNAVYVTQQINFKNNNEDEIRKYIYEHYEHIKKDAKMVITSRLHVASPCMAWGIPVIFAKRIIDDRFAWIDKYISLYSESEFADINWDPLPVSYDDEKEYILETVRSWIDPSENKDNVIQRLKRIDAYFENRCKREYADFRHVLFDSFQKKVERFLDNNELNKNSDFAYSIFGLGKAGENLYKYISKNYTKATLMYAVDNYKCGTWNGQNIVSMDKFIYESSGTDFLKIVFVASVSGGEEAQIKLFGKDKYKCCFLSDRFLQFEG